jgi:uncharacterized protein YqeY
MTTAERVVADMTSSLKAGTTERTGTLRLLIAEIKNKEKEKQAGSISSPQGNRSATLTEEEVIAVIQKESKKRKEAIELFKKGGREDLVKKDEAELRIIAEYLPKPLGDNEIQAVVERLFGEGHADFNSLMRESMKELKGKVDGTKLAELIKRRLGS